ncbi:unnamed protein product [Pleuronectes platessa]|uniref:Uncharacterized protein n=1 Tax=Pleuronectes platessa TaxID=8262 RepID=A0A9N7VWA6_PLEPL|nr:unnamed protein product [Pleuronectes platessa]
MGQQAGGMPEFLKYEEPHASLVGVMRQEEPSGSTLRRAEGVTHSAQWTRKLKHNSVRFWTGSPIGQFLSCFQRANGHHQGRPPKPPRLLGSSAQHMCVFSSFLQQEQEATFSCSGGVTSISCDSKVKGLIPVTDTCLTEPSCQSFRPSSLYQRCRPLWFVKTLVMCSEITARLRADMQVVKSGSQEEGHWFRDVAGGLVGAKDQDKNLTRPRFSGIKQQGGLYGSAVTGQHPPLYGGKGVPVLDPFCNLREYKHGQTGSVQRARKHSGSVDVELRV